MEEEFIVVDTVDTCEEIYNVSGGFSLPDFMYEEIKDVVSKLVKKIQCAEHSSECICTHKEARHTARQVFGLDGV